MSHGVNRASRPLDPEPVTGVWRGKPRAQAPTAPVTLRFVYLAFPANARRMARPARSDLADDAEILVLRRQESLRCHPGFGSGAVA